MIKCPDIAKQEIRKLEQKGIQPTLDQLAMLIKLAERVTNPKPPAIPSVTVLPARVCDGVLLWPMTIQGDVWHTHVTEQCWFDGVEDTNTAFAFALCHGRRRGFFDNLYEQAAAVDAVRQWRMALPVTLEELSAAILAVVDEPSGLTRPADPAKADNTEGGWGDILAELEAISGQPVDYWLTNSSDYALAVLEKCYKSRVLAAGGEWKHNARYQDAIFEFMLAIEEIRKAHNGEQSS